MHTKLIIIIVITIGKREVCNYGGMCRSVEVAVKVQDKELGVFNPIAATHGTNQLTIIAFHSPYNAT